MGILILLAESDPKAVVGADPLSFVERAVNGGPAIILGLLVLALGYIVWKMWLYIQKLETTFRESSVQLLREQLEQSSKLADLLTQSHVILTRNEEVAREVVELMKSLKGTLEHTAMLGDLLARTQVTLARSEETSREMILVTRRLKGD